MHNNRKHWLVPSTVLMLIAASAWLWISPTSAKAAPNVVFHTLKGQSFDLQQMRGKPVLLNFWATTCSSCLEEIPHLIEVYEEFNPQGFELIAVAMPYDPPNRVLELSESRELPYPVSLDLDSAIALAFDDVRLTPSSFLIDPNGQIVLRKLGALDLPALRRQIKSYL